MSYLLPGSKNLEDTEPDVLSVCSSTKTKYQHKDTGLELLNSLQLVLKEKLKQNN